MRIGVEVKNRKEGELIKLGLSHDDVRAFVVIVGALSGLSSDRARRRVLNYIADIHNEQAHKGNGVAIEEHDDDAPDTFD